MGKLTARINHSGFVSIFLLIVYISVSTLPLRRTQSAESNKTTDIIFGNKVFSDLGVVVYITGTLTGDGVAYKNNTIAVTCYIDRRECLVSSIQQIGENQIGRLDMPGIYPITKWDQYQIIASAAYKIFSSGFVNCRNVTISLDRKAATVAWVEEPINRSSAACKEAETRIFRWTIEDSPSWKALHK